MHGKAPSSIQRLVPQWALRLFAIVPAAAALGLSGAAGAAGAVPNDTRLNIVVPYPAGGSGDAIARMLADGLREHLGGRIVLVDNKPGANGRIALTALKAAPADGSTVVLAVSGVLVNSIIFQNSKEFNFRTDFAPHRPSWCHASSPGRARQPQCQQHRRVRATASQGRRLHLRYARLGLGGAPHRPAICRRRQDERQPRGLPGRLAMANDLMGSQLDAGIDTAGDFVERHKGEKLRVLGVFGAKRFPLLPDVPTLAEQGYPGLDAEVWLGFIGTSKLPAAWSQNFQDALKKTLDNPATRDKLAKLLAVDYKGSDDFAKVMARDFEVWTPILNSLGIINK